MNLDRLAQLDTCYELADEDIELFKRLVEKLNIPLDCEEVRWALDNWSFKEPQP